MCFGKCQGKPEPQHSIEPFALNHPLYDKVTLLKLSLRRKRMRETPLLIWITVECPRMAGRTSSITTRLSDQKEQGFCIPTKPQNPWKRRAKRILTSLPFGGIPLLFQYCERSGKFVQHLCRRLFFRVPIRGTGICQNFVQIRNMIIFGQILTDF